MGDGRRRGQRPKGQRNFDTEFEEESRRRMTIRENGKVRHVTKLRGAFVRTFDSAYAKADSRAQSLVFSHAARIGDKRAPQAGAPSPDDDELNAWLRDRQRVIDDSQQESLDQSSGSPSIPRRSEPDGQ